MNNYSLTLTGVLVSVFGTLLVQFGFSDACSNEITTNIPLLIGAAITWYGRYRAGGVTVGGWKQ